MECIETFLQNHPTFLPAVLAFSCGPYASLDAWLTVKEVDAPVTPSKPSKWKAVLATVVLTAVIVAVEVGLFAYDFDINLILTGLFALSAQGALFTLFETGLSAGRWSAHRTSMGTVAWRLQDKNMFKLALVILAALAVNYGAWTLPGSNVFRLIVYVALLYKMSATSSGKTISLRGITICLLVWIGGTLLLSIPLAALAVHLDQAGASDDVAQVLERPFNETVAAILPIFWNFGPALMIATCLRFDYYRFAEHNPELVAAARTIEHVDPPARWKMLTRGVVYARSRSYAFARPYYCTAFLSWISVNLLAGAYFVYRPVPKELQELRLPDLVTLFLQIPVMIVALVVVSKMRGDLAAFWTYREHWAVKPVLAVQLPETDANTDNDGQMVPAYEVNAKEDAVLPAYTVAAEKA